MREALGVAAIVVGIYSYIPYFRDIFRGKTKPHAFSFLVWGILTAIGFVAQVQDKAGPGAWVTGFTALVCFAIFILALDRGEKNIVLTDWLCLVGAFIAMGFWVVTDDALTAVLLVTLIDAIGFIPTFRKAYHKPYQETAITYGLSALKFCIALIALTNFSLITVLYPASLVVMNGLFVIMLAVRRRQIGPEKA